MKLVIVESPSKSKTIEKYLGKDYKVMASIGHVRDLTTTGKEGLGVDVDNNFKPTYAISPDKKQIVEELKANVKKADYVYLATDPDREGEAISWHLAEILDLNEKDNNRIEFHEVTKKAVLNALDNPRTIDMNLVKSQETRRIEDRIIGFKLSKLLQKKIKSKSAGRVQSIALRLICDKEKEIEAFKPEEYWNIDATLKNGRNKIKVSLNKIDGNKAEIKNEQEANELISNTKEPLILSEISKKSKKRAAYLPFTTSTLQQTSSTKLGFSSKKTMMLAQGLYEGVKLKDNTMGLITYMRTDSTRLSDDFVASLKNMIKDKYGDKYVGYYRIKNSDKAQDAHEGIRPTSLDNVPEDIKDYLTNDQYKLYKLIYYRTVASLMSEVITETTTYSFTTNNLTYCANGSVEKFDGFLKVYRDYDSSKEVELPLFNEGDEFKIDSIEPSQHFSEAPARYSEATLIKALEENGVGRPSTYATIIDTIEKRAYVELKKNSEKSKTKYFYPTEQGRLTDESLIEYFLPVINVEYTANMEKELDEIAENKIDNIKVLRKFYDELVPLVDNAYDKMPKKELEKTGEKCPMCGSDLVIRESKYGKFISCSNYPKCKYTKNETTGEKCPECGSEVVIRSGKYGKFLACENYPTCKYHKALNEKEAPETLDRVCPECGKPLLKRKSRYGTYFVACSGFPKCKYTESIEGEKPKYFRRKKTK